MWKIETFGEIERFGHIAGYQVVRRDDRETQVAQKFISDPSVDGSKEQAWSAAQSLCNHLNGSR